LNHTGTAIAGPNNDTLYVILALDSREEPIAIGYPAFDPKYVSLETPPTAGCIVRKISSSHA
jgi:hypothetical protein